MAGVKLAFQNQRPPEDRDRLSASDLIGGTSEKVQNKYQQLLEWHGIPTAEAGDEFVGNCPFHDCPSFIEQKPDKFTAFKQTCQWRCFVCGRSGNAPTFIQQIHQNFLEQTTETQLHSLRSLRHGTIDLQELQEMQLAYNTLTKEWILPSWNVEGKITNLYIWREAFDPETGRKYKQILSSPSFHQLPYGLHRIRHGSNRPIIVLEGHWDYLSMMSLLRRLDLTATRDIVASPGPFPQKYVSLFNGRDVILLGDNDPAGTAMMAGTISAMAKANVMPLSVRQIVWPKGLPNKYDVSDVIAKLPAPLRKKGTKLETA